VNKEKSFKSSIYPKAESVHACVNNNEISFFLSVRSFKGGKHGAVGVVAARFRPAFEQGPGRQNASRHKGGRGKNINHSLVLLKSQNSRFFP
jgi:hypothetical protein